MAFENLNYSTEEQIDENSIQDRIDQEKLEISQLTKENLKKLKVDILESKSYLKIRSKDGKVIGKLKDNDIVSYSGEKILVKYGKGEKIFLGVNLKNGKIGYVSADYVKGDINNAPKIILPPLIPAKKQTSVPFKNPPTQDTPKVIIPFQSTPKQDVPTKVEPVIDTPSEKTSPELLSKIEVSYENNYIYDEGKIFLIGKDGVKLEQKRELTKENLDLIKNYEKIAILNEILEIWKSEAINVADGVYFKKFRTDHENIRKYTSKIEEYFSKIIDLTQKGETDKVEKLIDDIFATIQASEAEKGIIGFTDMQKVKEVFNSNKNKDEKLVKIFNLMRYKGLSGNSSTVKEKLTDHMLQSDEYADIGSILQNEKLIEHISNNNTIELAKLLGSEDLSKEVLSAYKKIKTKQEQNREKHAENLLIINKERVKNNQAELKLNDFIEMNVNFSIQNLVKHSLIRNKIALSKNRGNEKNNYTGVYANISGLGQTEGYLGINDAFVIADDNIDNAIDVGSTVALSFVSMGVGALAARGTVALLSYGAKAATITDRVNKLGKIGSAAKFGGTITAEGVAFYEATNVMNNIIYGNDLGENAGNKKEIFKSIAFMGVLRGVGKVMQEAKIANELRRTPGMIDGVNVGKLDLGITGNTLSYIGKMSEKVPPLMFKNTSITGVLAEAGLLTGTSVGLEVVFEGEGHFTWEEYFQAIVMVGLFKGASKLIYSKNKDGKIEVKEELGQKLIEYTPKDKTGYILNGKTFKWSEKQQKFLHKSGEMYSKEEFAKLQLQYAPKIEYVEKTEKIDSTKTKNQETKTEKENTDSSKPKPEKSKTEENLESTKPLKTPNAYKEYIKKVDSLIDLEIKLIKKGEKKEIGNYTVEKSSDGKKYKITERGKEIAYRINKEDVAKTITGKITSNDELYSFLNAFKNKKIETRLGKIKGEKIEDNLFFDKKDPGKLVDDFGKPIEFSNLNVKSQAKVVEKITGMNFSTRINTAAHNLKGVFSKKGKADFEAGGGEAGFVKKTWLNLWTSIKDSGNNKNLSYFEAYKPNKLLGPAFSKEGRSAWKKILAGTLGVNIIGEIIENDKNISLAENISNVVYNTTLFSAGGLYVGVFGGALIDTIIGQVGNYEKRSFLPSLFDNTLSNTGVAPVLNIIPGVNLPEIQDAPYSLPKYFHNSKSEIEQQMNERYKKMAEGKNTQ